MRGTQEQRDVSILLHRFIPAYAGNTLKPEGLYWQTTVHPRVCGEHEAQDIEAVFLFGSSPRMRGTHADVRKRIMRDRFIPAYAGNTTAIGCRTCCQAVHPRVCGEHSIGPGRSPMSNGSSPRMRGTHFHVRVVFPHVRFIPAYAGNTRCLASASRLSAVHPRVCGEHPYHRDVVDTQFGSSPRMRGTRQPARGGNHIIRFIPAYAGNTRRAARGRSAKSVHPRVCGEHQ